MLSKAETLFHRYRFLFGILFFLFFYLILRLSAVTDNGFHFDGLVAKGADYDEQYNTVDNLVKYGTLSMQEGEHGEPYANRTPGYIFPYVVFAWLLPQYWAWQAIGLTQILFTVFSAGLLYELLKRFSGSFLFSFVSYFLFIAGSYFSFFISELSPENLSLNAFVVALYAYFRYLDNRATSALLLSGAFMAWCAHLRGFTIPYFAIFSGFILLQNIRPFQFRNMLRELIIFLFPFMLITTVWTVRNYIQFKEIVPLQRAYVPGQQFEKNIDYYDPAKYSVSVYRKLITVWGGDCLWYFPGTEMHWTLSSADSTLPPAIPKRVFGEGFSEADLLQLRKDIRASYSFELSNSQHDSLEQLIVSKSLQYRNVLLKAHPEYRLIGPLKRILHMFNKNVATAWPVKAGSLGHYYKGITVLNYYGFLALAVLALFFFRKFKKQQWLLTGLLAITLLEFALLVELFHFKYFITAFVCVMLLGASAFGYLKGRSGVDQA